MQQTGPMVYHPYPRILEFLCHSIAKVADSLNHIKPSFVITTDFTAILNIQKLIKKERDLTVIVTFLCLFLGFRSSKRNYQHESSL